MNKKGFLQNSILATLAAGMLFGMSHAQAASKTLSVENSQVGAVYGAWFYRDNIDAYVLSVSNSIIGSTYVDPDEFSVLGGWSSGGNISNNQLTITGGTVYGRVAGGQGETGDVTVNTVTIMGNAEINGDVFGGLSMDSGTVGGNTVDVQGGTINGNIYGGYSENGNVTGNKIKIYSANAINGEVFGGYSVNGTVANDNQIFVGGKVQADNAKFHNVCNNGESLFVHNDITENTTIKKSDNYDGGTITLADGVVLTLNNDRDDSWFVDFRVKQAKDAESGTLKFTGQGFAIGQYNGAKLDVTNIEFNNTFADVDVACIGGNVEDIVVNSTYQVKIYNLSDYTLNADVSGTGLLEIESENDKAITVASGKTVSVALDILKDVDSETEELQGQGKLSVNANQLSGNSDIKNAGVLILTGGTLSRNVTDGTLRKINQTTENVVGSDTVAGTLTIGGNVTLATGKFISSSVEVNEGQTFEVHGTLSGQTNNYGIINFGDGATNTAGIKNYGTINITDGATVSKQISSSKTGTDVINISGTIVENSTDVGKYGIGASILNIHDADLTSNHALRGYQVTVVDSTLRVPINGLMHSGSGIYDSTYDNYGNVITIENSTVNHTVRSGYSSLLHQMKDTTMGSIHGNTVIADGSYVNFVIGGESSIADDSNVTSAYTTGDVYDNVVILKNGAQVGHEGNHTDHVIGGQTLVTYGQTASEYYEQHRVGKVHGNGVEITNSTIYSNIYGGYSNRDTEIYENSIAINVDDGHSVTADTIVGGYACNSSEMDVNASNVHNNTVTLTGDTINVYSDGYGWVAGGYSHAGLVSYNEVTINGGTYAEIDGGWSHQNNADHNTLTIKAGSFTEVMGGGSRPGDAIYNVLSVVTDKSVTINEAYAGFSRTGSTNYNITTIDGANIVINELLAGGCAYKIEDGFGPYISKDAIGNSLEITGATIYGSVYGGRSKNGLSKDNTVTVHSGYFGGDVYGGSSEGGNVTGNSVTLLNSEFTSNYSRLARYAGGYSMGQEVGSNNIVLGSATDALKFYDSAWVIGGASIGAGTMQSGVVDGNSIVINNAEFNLTRDDEDVTQRYTHIVAGRGEDGDVTNNSLVIRNITLNSPISSGDNAKNNVWGGFAQNEGDVIGNSITIEKGTLNINWLAGGSTNFGDAISNTVIIGGTDTIIAGGTVFGGRCAQGAGEVSENTVTITGGTIDADIYGGYSNGGNVSESTVTISNATVTGNVYGGLSMDGNVSGNIININAGSVIDGMVIGGYSDDGNAVNNQVNIVAGVTVNGDVYGGYVVDGIVQDNQICVSGQAVSDEGKYHNNYVGNSLFEKIVIDEDTTLYPDTEYNGHDTLYVKDAVLTLDADGFVNNFDVTFNIRKANGAEYSTLFVDNGHFWLGDMEAEDDDSNWVHLNVDKVIVGENAQATFDAYTSRFGSNLKEIEINSVAPQGTIVYYYGALFDGHCMVAGEDPDHFGANISGDGTFFINGDMIFDDTKSGDTYNYVISSGIDILHRYINDAEDGCDHVEFDSSLTINADQLVGDLPVRNAGKLILTGGTLRRDVVAGTYRYCDVDDDPKESFFEYNGTVCVTGDVLSVAEGVSVEQVVYAGQGGSNNTLSLTLGDNSNVVQIIGGYGENGANNNAVTISGSGSIEHDTEEFEYYEENNFAAIAGLADNGNVTGNSLTVNGGVFEHDILAAATSEGNANNNTVSIYDGKFYDHVAGGCIVKGTAENNQVSISGGYFENHLEQGNDIVGANYGDEIPEQADFIGNSVTITGGTFDADTKRFHVYGADGSNSSGDVKNNTVFIKHVEIKADVVGGYVNGGIGNVTGNSVTIQKEQGDAVTRITGSILGGASLQCSDYAAVVSNNSVNVSGGTLRFVGGGLGTGIYGGRGEHKVSGNSVTLYGSGYYSGKNEVISNIIGGLSMSEGEVCNNIVTLNASPVSADSVGSYYGKTKIIGGTNNAKNGNLGFGDVHDNKVIVNNGKFGLSQNFENEEIYTRIIGGGSYSGTVSQNSVEFNAGIINSQVGSTRNVVYGGFAVAGDIENNTVTFNGGEINADVFGGYSTVGDVSANKVVVGTNARITGNVYGGYSDFGNVTNNIVDVKSGAVVNGNVYGGYGVAENLGNVADNTVSISGGATVTGKVINDYQGESWSNTIYGENGTGFDNKIVIVGGQHDDVSGAWVYSGDAGGNEVIISGGTFASSEGVKDGDGNWNEPPHVVGGCSEAENGSAFENVVYVTGGQFYATIIGGETTANGVAEGNRVTFVGATLELPTDEEEYFSNEGMYGGAAFNNGDAVNNVVTIGNSDSIVANIYGGYADDGDVENNFVTIINSTVTGNIYGGYGGGCIDNNEVRLTSGTVYGNVYGAYSNENDWSVYDDSVDALNGDVDGNIVEMYGGSITGNIYGGYGYGGNNSIYIRNGEVDGNVYGGYGYAGDYNVVEMDGGSVTGSVYGGYGYAGKYNVIKVRGGSITGSVYGGYFELGGTDETYVGDNNVEISAGMIGGNVYGGYSVSGDVKNNIINITGGTVNGNVYGGYSVSGDITNNIVNITGGKINGNVYGGYSESTTATVSGNTVNVSGDADMSEATVVENYKPALTMAAPKPKMLASKPMFSSAALQTTEQQTQQNNVTEQPEQTDNSDLQEGTVTLPVLMTAPAPQSKDQEPDMQPAVLKTMTVPATNAPATVTAQPKAGSFVLYDNWQGSVGAVDGFAKIVYKDIIWKNGGTILTVNNWAESDMDGTVMDLSDISIPGGKYNIGESMKLINDEDANGAAVPTIEGMAQPVLLQSAPLQSAPLGTMAPVAHNVRIGVAHLAEIGTPSSYSNTIILTNMVQNPQTVTVAESKAAAAAFINQGHDMIEQGLNQLMDHGTGIQTFAGMQASDNKYTTGSNVEIDGKNTIVGVAKTLDNGLTYGIFYEMGNGDYDTYADGYHGEGKQNYKGGGLIATKQYKNGNYIETSIRGGKLKNDLRTTDMTDNTGKEVPGYETDTKYYGIHIGMGKNKQISSHRNLDIYGKYFYTHTNSNNITIDGDQFRLDSVNSHTIKLGAKLTHNLGNKYNIYYGAAYEYTFDGDIKGTVDGENMKQHSLGGGRAMIEIGSTMKASDKWSFDCNVKGYTGRREGMTYNLQAVYSF